MRLVSPKLKGSKSVEGTAAVVGGQGCRSTSEVRTRSCLYSASFHALSLQSLFRNEPLTAMGFNENSSRKKRALLSLGSKCSQRISCMHIQGRAGGWRKCGGGHMTEWDIKLPQNLHRQEHWKMVCFVMLFACPRQSCTCCLYPLDKVLKKRREKTAMISFCGKYASFFVSLGF